MEIRNNVNPPVSPVSEVPRPAEVVKPANGAVSSPGVPEVLAPEQSAASKQAAKVKEQDIIGAVERLNDTAKAFNKKISFKIDNQRGDMLRVFIVNDDDQVIRAIPPDEVLDVSERIKSALGMIFDKKA